MNNSLKLALDKGATMKMVAEDWEFLHVKECMYVCMCIFIYFKWYRIMFRFSFPAD
jgi:hypothetical protein